MKIGSNFFHLDNPLEGEMTKSYLKSNSLCFTEIKMYKLECTNVFWIIGMYFWV